MYISDFYSDSNEVIIRFLKGKIETELKTTLDKLDIKLKNTTTSLGFNCEIRLKVKINILLSKIDLIGHF